MNPEIQRMDSLVANMPKIWKMENKAVDANLSMGKFHFSFQAEGVINNGPYHSDPMGVHCVFFLSFCYQFIG